MNFMNNEKQIKVKKKYVYEYGKRRFCTCCNTRKYETDMFHIHVPVISKKYWICYDCLKNNYLSPPIILDSDGNLIGSVESCLNLNYSN